jgi:hypothetical protein
MRTGIHFARKRSRDKPLRLMSVYLGCGTIRMYGFGAFHP